MNGTLTGRPDVDEAIRRLLGQDDDEDDGEAGEWDGVTELVEIFPTRLDGVSGPASGIPALMAKAARRPVATRVLKADGAKRVTMHVAYPVDAVDRAVALDGARDFVKADALEAGAWAFMKSGAKVGTDHRDGTTGAGTVVESWIHRAPPWSMTAVDGSRQTVNPGDWCVLIQWSPAAWARFQKGDLNGVSMQGSAKRRKPPASALAGVRKAARPPKCGKCSKRAKRADARFCTKCGRAFGKPGAGRAAKSAAVLKAQAALAEAVTAEATRTASRLGRELDRARSADPAERGDAFGRLTAEFGAGTAARLLSGEVSAAGLAVRMAKAAVAEEAGRCKTCDGRKRLRHPGTGAYSRTCPSCRGTGKWSPDGDKADMTDEDASLIQEAARKARSGGMDAPDGLGMLIALLGADLAMKAMAGAHISPAEFRRGYISACRANQAAKPGQEPRIPEATHVIRPEDFQRPPLVFRQSRPAPGSAWPGQGGQRDHYEGAGVDTRSVPWSGRTPAATWVTPGLASSGRMVG